MKKLVILFLTLAIAICALSCGSKYTNNKSAEEVYNETANAIKTQGGMKLLDADKLLEVTESNPSYLKDFIFAKAESSSNLNEYGIFRVDAGKENDMLDLVQKYVSKQQDMYRAFEYFPEETEKVESARAVVIGNYIVYSFLSESDTQLLYDAIKACIAK